MIEVLFGESEAGAMKAAKSKVLSIVSDGPTATFCAGKKKPPSRESAGWIEGTSEEVICPAFMFDVGRLDQEVDREYRKKLICSMLNQGQWGEEEEPVLQARLIGNILGRYPVSVGDWWYAKRIQYHIDRGGIEVVEDSKKKYARLIKRSSGAD